MSRLRKTGRFVGEATGIRPIAQVAKTPLETIQGSKERLGYLFSLARAEIRKPKKELTASVLMSRAVQFWCCSVIMAALMSVNAPGLLAKFSGSGVVGVMVTSLALLSLIMPPLLLALLGLAAWIDAKVLARGHSSIE